MTPTLLITNIKAEMMMKAGNKERIQAYLNTVNSKTITFKVNIIRVCKIIDYIFPINCPNFLYLGQLIVKIFLSIQ